MCLYFCIDNVESPTQFYKYNAQLNQPMAVDGTKLLFEQNQWYYLIWATLFCVSCSCLLDCYLTHRPLGDLGAILKLQFSILFLLIDIFTLSDNNALRWMPRDLPNDKSALVQVKTWRRQATSHYLSQCWPSSMLASQGLNQLIWSQKPWFMLNISSYPDIVTSQVECEM